MSRVLRFPAEGAPLAAAFTGLRAALDQVAVDSKVTADSRKQSGAHVDTIQWAAANRLFGQRGYAFRRSFLNLTNNDFAAPLETVDFRGNPEKGRGTINAWAEETTRQKIRNLVPAGALTENTRLVLVNALYLKAPWQNPFEKRATKPQPFRTPNTDPRDVPTMHRLARLRYAKENGLIVVALDYLGSALQFLILLPDEGQSPEAAAAKLTSADFGRWAKPDPAMHATSVALSLPRFRVAGET